MIQEASLRSLQGGTTLAGIFELIKKLRLKTQIPISLMLYMNTIYCFGIERFFTLCENIGIDAAIVPDLPFEEHDEIDDIAYSHGVYPINIVASTSKERISTIAANSKGFLYGISVENTSNLKNSIQTDFQNFSQIIHQNATIPYCIDFDNTSLDEMKQYTMYCDGIIVGSTIVNIIKTQKQDAISAVGALIKALRNSLDKC